MQSLKKDGLEVVKLREEQRGALNAVTPVHQEEPTHTAGNIEI